MNEKQKTDLRKVLPHGQSMSDEKIEEMGKALQRYAQLLVNALSRENKKGKQKKSRVKEALYKPIGLLGCREFQPIHCLECRTPDLG